MVNQPGSGLPVQDGSSASTAAAGLTLGLARPWSQNNGDTMAARPARCLSSNPRSRLVNHTGVAGAATPARGMTPCAGFTFVEILLTLVILMISVVPLMQLYAAAIEGTGTIDEIRTAIDLTREEIEKIKNLALTEEQIKQLGNVASPPVMLNKTAWFTVRVIDPNTTPLRVTVFAFRDRISGKPVAALVTLISK